MRDLFLFRLHKLASTASHSITCLCEGRYGITRREWRLILTLGRMGRLLATQLAIHARLDPARASRGVTLLVEKGLAVREPRPNDRRYVDIALTAGGQRIYDEMLPVVLEIDDQLLSVLTPEERELLHGMLARMEQRAESPLSRAVLPKTDRRKIGRSHRL